MKNWMIVFTLGLLAQNAMAAELKCWLTDFRGAKVPFMSAEIRANQELGSLKFHYQKMASESGVNLVNPQRPVPGALIESNRSPYKSQVRYLIPKVGDLILPAKLDNQSLTEIEKAGIGMWPSENGVLITSTEYGDGAGNHVSYRLSCRSGNGKVQNPLHPKVQELVEVFKEDAAVAQNLYVFQYDRKKFDLDQKVKELKKTIADHEPCSFVPVVGRKDLILSMDRFMSLNESKTAREMIKKLSQSGQLEAVTGFYWDAIEGESESCTMEDLDLYFDDGTVVLIQLDQRT